MPDILLSVPPSWVSGLVGHLRRQGCEAPRVDSLTGAVAFSAMMLSLQTCCFHYRHVAFTKAPSSRRPMGREPASAPERETGYECGYGYCLPPHGPVYRRALRTTRTRSRTRARMVRVRGGARKACRSLESLGRWRHWIVVGVWSNRLAVGILAAEILAAGILAAEILGAGTPRREGAERLRCAPRSRLAPRSSAPAYRGTRVTRNEGHTPPWDPTVVLCLGA